jgi:hypothetical protein
MAADNVAGSNASAQDGSSTSKPWWRGELPKQNQEAAPQSDIDKFKEGSEKLLDAQKLIDQRELRKLTGRQLEFEKRQPRDILRQLAAPPFDYEDVPEPIANLAYHFSEATGFDRTGVIVAATVAAASMIDDKYRLEVRPESNWRESARLWGVLVAPPSAGKTPGIRAATGTIKDMHEAAWIQWHDQYQDEKPQDRPPEPAL